MTELRGLARSHRRVHAAPLVLMLLIALAAPAAFAQTNDDFFSGDTVQEIRLYINSDDWIRLHTNYLENTYYTCDLKWRDITVQNVGVKSRGFGSRSGTKPALRIDMNRYSDDQEFLGLTSFVLDNMVQDPSGIRERVSMELFQRMGLPAPRETHARLYVNNNYEGLYLLVESLDKHFLKRFYGEINGDTQNDGYLFDYNWVDPYYFTDLGPDLQQWAIRFEPQTHKTATASKLYDPLREMVRTINDARDDMFEARAGVYFDMPIVMKHLAVENFLAEYDGIVGFAGMANFYLYRLENQDRYQFIAWDKDATFHIGDDVSPHGWDFPILQGLDTNVLSRRAFAVDSLRDAYFDGLLKSADSAMQTVDGAAGPGWLESEIRRIYAQIRTAMLEDTVKPYANDQFEQAVELVVAFAQQRAAFVRCQVATVHGGDVDAACAASPATLRLSRR